MGGQSYEAELAHLDVLEEGFAVAADCVALAMLAQIVGEGVFAIFAWISFFRKAPDFITRNDATECLKSRSAAI